MSQFTERIRENFRSTSLYITIFLVRLITGTLLGLTLALIVDNLTPVSTFLFMFIVISSMAIILRLTRYWSLLATIILLLVLVLIGVLLKLYIHTAATV